MSLASIGDTELHYRVRGDHGPPLLLIMGFGAGADEWDALAEDLARDHRVLAFDHAGLGGSGPVPNRLDMPTLVEHVDALLDHVGWDAAHIVGMSMGGMVAQHYALERSERVRSASLLVSSAHGPTALRTTRAAYRKLPRLVLGKERARARAVAELLHGSLGESRLGMDALIDKQLRLVGFAPFRVLRAHWQAILGHDTRRRLPGLDLRVPMLIIGASEDCVIPASETDRLAGLLPAARLRWVDGAGHNVHQDATPEVAGALRRLVRSIESPQAQAG
jgi:pimeloyl-ACP methyl ester carboxylesterase